MRREPLIGPAAWRGEELIARRESRYRFSEADLDEIDRALQAAPAMRWNEVSPATFVLPNLAATMQQISDELAEGCGVAKLGGLPVARWSDDQLRRIYLGLSAHLGKPTEQNGARGLLRDIEDRSAQGGQRVDSADALRWHNDRTDIVGLFCVREAASGGISKLVSVSAIHNAMLARCPALLEVLFRDFNRYTPGDEVGGTEGCHALPVFRMHASRLSAHFSRTYIDQAARLPGADTLSADQVAALDTLLHMADEFACEMRLQAGEIQYLNNHAILHGRTPFKDDASRGAQRLLLRVWLATQVVGKENAWPA